MAQAPWDDDGTSNVLAFEAWRGELCYKPDGQTLEPKDCGNFRVLLTNHVAIAGKIRLNLFTQVVELTDVPWNRSSAPRPLADGDIVRAREWLQRLRLKPTKDEVRDALLAAAEAQAYHPIRDYLTGLQWDGVERLDLWLRDCLGVEDCRYSRLIAPKVLLSAVARIMRPGCQVDTMLVLEGDQGLGKSSAIAALFGRSWTRESVSLFQDHKRMVMLMAGAWVVELAEFVAVHKGDQSSVKGLISTRTDSVVLPYARAATNHPRQCIFMGTINPTASGYLSDSTGNRRYWPVTVTRIDLVAIEATREQLWAEARQRFETGERWWLTGDEIDLASNQQADRGEDDPWDDVLAEKLEGMSTVYPETVLAKLGIPAERQNKAVQMRAAECMKRLGFVRERGYAGPRGARKLTRVWKRADDLFEDGHDRWDQ